MRFGLVTVYYTDLDHFMPTIIFGKQNELLSE